MRRTKLVRTEDGEIALSEAYLDSVPENAICEDPDGPDWIEERDAILDRLCGRERQKLLKRIQTEDRPFLIAFIQGRLDQVGDRGLANRFQMSVEEMYEQLDDILREHYGELLRP